MVNVFDAWGVACHGDAEYVLKADYAALEERVRRLDGALDKIEWNAIGGVMSSLICSKCELAAMRWVNPEMKNLIFSGTMECKNKKCKARFTMEQFHQAWLDKHPPDPKDQTIAALETELIDCKAHLATSIEQTIEGRAKWKRFISRNSRRVLLPKLR